MPLESTLPTWGKSVGGVSQRPTREGMGSDPHDRPRSRRWKAPDLRKCGTLRGGPEERRSRSVRYVRGGLFLCGRVHRRQWVPLGRRGGERRQRALNHHTHPARGPTLASRDLRGHVLHSVQGPVLVNRGSTRAAQAVRGHAIGQSSRSGKPGQPGGTDNGARSTRTQCGSPRITAPSPETMGDAFRKGRRLRPSSLRGSREFRSSARTSYAVAEIGRRCLTSNKLPRSAPKRVTAGVNGGLARNSRRRSRRR